MKEGIYVLTMPLDLVMLTQKGLVNGVRIFYSYVTYVSIGLILKIKFILNVKDSNIKDDTVMDQFRLKN